MLWLWITTGSAITVTSVVNSDASGIQLQFGPFGLCMLEWHSWTCLPSIILPCLAANDKNVCYKHFVMLSGTFLDITLTLLFAVVV